MKKGRTTRNRRREGGIALLISIFVLLLISVVAIALIVSSGTESALAGNYRSSTGVYYAALAGIEEARGRLSTKNPNAFNTTDPGFLPSPGNTMQIGYVSYVLNPGPTDNIATMLTTAYPDGEYDQEFGAGQLAAANAAGHVQTARSVWNRAPLNALNVPGPMYKWVRINPVSELSLNLDVSPYDTNISATTPVYFDGTNMNDVNNGSQVFEITALAVLPNGSQKIVQYLTSTTPVTMPPLPAALTLAGSQTVSRVAYTAPQASPGFIVDGRDYDCNGNPNALGSNQPAVGVFNSSDTTAVITGGNGGLGIPNAYRSTNYPGFAGSPDVVTVNGAPFPTNLQKPSALDNIVQSITQNADVIITPSSGPATGTDLTNATPGMSFANPMTVVVNGDLNLNAWHHSGYGLLLVTGNLNYDPDASWDGVVLVIGKGTVTGHQGGVGLLLGAILVANTRDSSGNLWPDPTLGPLSVNFNNGGSMQGAGIKYSSCWIQKAQPSSSYKIISFHEISQ